LTNAWIINWESDAQPTFRSSIGRLKLNQCFYHELED